jgi:hypothetical protein
MALKFAGLTIPPAAALNAAAPPRPLAAAGARSLIPVTYGEDRVSALILNVLYGPGNTLVVQCLWGHACHQVDELRLNDAALPAGSTVTSYDGTQTTPDATLVAIMAGPTYTDTLAGYAYSVVSMPIRAFDGQLNFTARIRGRKLYDPRKDSTAGGSGTHRLATPSTWEYSDNPSLALADWWANAVFGAGEPVLWSSVGPAATANDAMIGSPAEKHRVIGLSLTSAAGIPAVGETLRAYAGCWLVPTGGGVKLLPDADASPVASYSHASGEIAALESLTLSDHGNSPTVVEVIYTDTSQIPWRDATAQAIISGAGTTLPWRLSGVRLPGIQRYSQAYREAVERLNKLTLGDLSTSVEVFDVGIRHERGDIITLTHPLGITAKPMRVNDVEMPAFGRWLLAVVEHDPAAYSTLVTTTPTYPDTALVLSGPDEVARNLIDPSWWAPGAAWEWPRYVGATASNAIVWGSGPRGLQQPLWQSTAVAPGGGVNGGWESGNAAVYPKNFLVVDPSQAYRFALPVRLVSGTGWWQLGPIFGGAVCTLNTSTPVADPRFYLAASAPAWLNRWCLLVGYVFPAGSTGLSNAGAGVYDMETGALLAGGTNFCWSASATECGMRAFFTDASTGAVNQWGYPLVERLDNFQRPDVTYIGGLAVGTGQLANKSVTVGLIEDSSTTVGSTGSPGSSTRAVTLWGPEITTEAGDELDINVVGILEESFWSQAAIAYVELWLTHAPTFGGTQTEFGVRRKFSSPVDAFAANNTFFSMDMQGQIAPGAATKNFVLRATIAYRDAAGAAKQCGKDFTANAQWRVVRRKR